jgi:lysophospholipase L1-like esterase
LKNFKMKTIQILTLMLTAWSMVAAQSPDPDLTKNPAATKGAISPALPTVFIAGDSTAAKNNGNPIQGWGEPFGQLFDPAKVNVANRARGGRSSRTFITEGLWDALMGEVKAGDVVLIQFGHNDGGAINEEPPGSTRPLRARGSLPGLGDETAAINNAVTHQPEVVRTYGSYVRQMVAAVQARGATPVLMSPTVRNIWNDGWVERGTGNYRQWSREIARDAGVPFVDLSRIVADTYQVVGESAVAGLFGSDHTHTNVAGAEFTAIQVVAGLKGLRKTFDVKPWLSKDGQAVREDRIGWLNLSEPADVALPSVFLIGDSTVRNGGGDGQGGQWGWGEPLAQLLDPKRINVVNRAIGGLSSRTFLTEGHWVRTLTMIRPGDWVVMQFGHNDSAPLNDARRARGTIKGTGDEAVPVDNLITGEFEVVHSFGWYLRRYIQDIRAAGAIPVVCSLVPRKTWQDGKIDRDGSGYAGWARVVAEKDDAKFIDLNAVVSERYDAMGEAAVEVMFADAHTHTSWAGAELNASLVAEALRAWVDFPENGSN